MSNSSLISSNELTINHLQNHKRLRGEFKNGFKCSYISIFTTLDFNSIFDAFSPLMIKEILPFSYSGTLQAPSSKSYVQRAIAIACLANGKSMIHGYTKSNDAEIALSVARQFGAEIKVEKIAYLLKEMSFISLISLRLIVAKLD